MPVFWVVWLEKNKRIFKSYRGEANRGFMGYCKVLGIVKVEVLWNKLWFWASLSAKVSSVFREIPPLEFLPIGRLYLFKLMQ